MKICYNCFHEMGDSMRFCENCGNNLGNQDNSGFPGALSCGTILYGRYLIGRVLEKDRLLTTYIAQDSRTGETVAIREFSRKGFVKGLHQRLSPYRMSCAVFFLKEKICSFRNRRRFQT